MGSIAFEKAWKLQEVLFQGIVDEKFANRKLPENERVRTADHLLFCEHPHVYTLGKSGKEENLLLGKNELNEIGASFHNINRGGDITYHGPGQLVGYPILNLDHFFTDIHKYLRYLEEVIIKIMSDYGLKGERSKGETGVWLDAEKPTARKICAMGIRTSRWVTMHGWALNVNTDLRMFDHIIPCGIDDKGVTSLQREVGKEIPMREVAYKAKKYFQEIFEVALVG